MPRWGTRCLNDILAQAVLRANREHGFGGLGRCGELGSVDSKANVFCERGASAGLGLELEMLG